VQYPLTGSAISRLLTFAPPLPTPTPRPLRFCCPDVYYLKAKKKMSYRSRHDVRRWP